MQDPQKMRDSSQLQRPSTSASAAGNSPGGSHTEHLWDWGVWIAQVPLPQVS